MLLVDGKATTVYDAVDKAYGTPFSIDGIKDLAKHTDVLIINDVPDNCNVNKRAKAATADAF